MPPNGPSPFPLPELSLLCLDCPPCMNWTLCPIPPTPTASSPSRSAQLSHHLQRAFLATPSKRPPVTPPCSQMHMIHMLLVSYLSCVECGCHKRWGHLSNLLQYFSSWNSARHRAGNKDVLKVSIPPAAEASLPGPFPFSPCHPPVTNFSPGASEESSPGKATWGLTKRGGS